VQAEVALQWNEMMYARCEPYRGLGEVHGRHHLAHLDEDLIPTAVLPNKQSSWPPSLAQVHHWTKHTAPTNSLEVELGLLALRSPSWFLDLKDSPREPPWLASVGAFPEGFRPARAHVIDQHLRRQRYHGCGSSINSGSSMDDSCTAIITCRGEDSPARGAWVARPARSRGGR
jgi:hypothetical protein